MAINVVTATVPRKHHGGKVYFCKHFDSADLSGCEQIMSMPTGATHIYLKKVVIASAVSLTVTLGDGETTGSLTTDVLGPITMNADVGTPSNQQVPATVFDHEFVNELAFSTDVSIDASAAGTVWGLIEGYYA